MTTERLLGSYLVRVSLRKHERHLAVHSVLTGERRSCADFSELASYLEAATTEAARSAAGSDTERQGEDEPGPTEADGPDLGGHGR